MARLPDNQTPRGVSTGRDLEIGGDHNQVAGGNIFNVRSESAMQRPPALLPADVSHFTGRQEELASLEAEVLATHGQAVVISAVTGKPGVGKSALAVHLAHQVADRFPDGQVYINLRGADQQPVPSGMALSELLHILGVPAEKQPSSLDGKASLYRHTLAGQRILVVIDNAYDDAQVRPLLPGSASGAVIITSRQILATLGARTLILDVLDAEQSLELLRRIVGVNRIDEDRQAALALVAVCGGLPLALQIVGAKLAARPDWSVSQVVDRLSDERRRLAELGMGDLSVRASFQLSYRALPEQHARAFRLLALWPGADFHLWVTFVLLDLELHELHIAQQILDDLVMAQLIEPGVTPGRYRMHDLLRLFAYEQVIEDETPADRDEAWILLVKAALRFVRQMVAALQKSGSAPNHDLENGTESTTALHWLETERANLIAIVNQAVARGPVEVSWELSAALYKFLDYRAYRTELCEMTEAAYRSSQAAGDRAAQSRAWNNLFHAYLGDDRLSDAENLLSERLSFVQESDDRSLRTNYILDLIEVYTIRKRYDDAEYLLMECLAAVRNLNDEHYEAVFLRRLGDLCRALNRLGDAEQALTSSLAISRKYNYLVHVADELRSLAQVYSDQGRPNDSEQALIELLAIDRRFKNRHHEAKTLSDLAHSYERCSHEHNGESSLIEALAIFRELGDRRCEVNTLACLGHVYADRGDLQRAKDALNAGIAICREISHSSRETELREALSYLQRARAGRARLSVDAPADGKD
jgi:tetratricopeptide (TPR) repeat protein